MTVQKTNTCEIDERKLFGMELQQGLEQMINFEQKLHQFSKNTLILFIVLNLDEDQFGRACEILKKLELLSDEPGIVGF